MNEDDHTMAWPNYKFGFKHSDLTTTLHDQYNTFTSTIQDPEAFHHDVWEISHEADTTDDFHRLMAQRRDQRLHELNDTMASLAVEIISNPKLIDSKHWKFALQLFRTKSFDSIVRYFASYLPDSDDIPHHTPSVSSSFSEAQSERTAATTASTASSVDTPIFFDHDDLDEGLGLTQEPCSLDDVDVDQMPHVVGAPLSPPESEPFTEHRSVTDFESHRSTSPASRSMSFSGSESEVFADRDFIRNHRNGHDDVESIPDERDTAVASLTDGAGSPSSIESADDYHQPTTPIHTFDDDEFDLPPTQFPEDDFDAFEFQHDDTQTPTITTDTDDTPTPRQETMANSYLEYKSVVTKRLPSPSRRPVLPKSSHHTPSLSPTMATRRSPEESLSRVSKPAFNGLQKKRGTRGLV